MNRKLTATLLVPLSLQGGPSARGGAVTTGLTVRSLAFADADVLPVRYTLPEAGGSNISPPLEWEGQPHGTSSFAIAVIDAHPVAEEFPHWLVHAIPPDVHRVAEGASGTAMPPGSVELRNGWGRRGWGGPRPPRGTGRHEYRFMLMALDVPRLEVPETADAPTFMAAAQPHLLESASVSAYFAR